MPLQSYPKGNILNKLIIRATMGMFGFLSCFMSLKLVAVSEAVVLMKTNPLWTTLILVYIQKKEKLTIRTLMEIIVCLVGVVFITKPPFLFGN
jgi:drug/metabolite transporter (DMT)-like permease